MEAIDPTSPHCHTRIMGRGGGHYRVMLSPLPLKIIWGVWQKYLDVMREILDIKCLHWLLDLECSEDNLENKINDRVWQFLCHSLTEYIQILNKWTNADLFYK